jgi:hypothetical protein
MKLELYGNPRSWQYLNNEQAEIEHICGALAEELPWLQEVHWVAELHVGATDTL